MRHYNPGDLCLQRKLLQYRLSGTNFTFIETEAFKTLIYEEFFILLADIRATLDFRQNLSSFAQGDLPSGPNLIRKVSFSFYYPPNTGFGKLNTNQDISVVRINCPGNEHCSIRSINGRGHCDIFCPIGLPNRIHNLNARMNLRSLHNYASLSFKWNQIPYI